MGTFDNYVCEGQLNLFDVIKEETLNTEITLPDTDRGGWKIVNQDCLEFMKNQKDKQYDVIFTSPPYNDSGSEKDGCVEKGFRHRKYSFAEYRDDWLEWQTECIEQMQRITKKFVLYNVQPILSNKNDVYKLIGNFANDIHMILIWYKPNAQPQHYEHRISNCYEMVLVIKGKDWNKKKFWLNTNGNRNVIVQNINSNHEYSKEHRALMSLNFAEEIIKNYTEEGDLIYDPFCGLATTGIACVKNNRNFVGTELNERYYELALKRMNKNFFNHK